MGGPLVSHSRIPVPLLVVTPAGALGQALGEGHASNSISLAAIAVSSTAHVQHCGEGNDGDIFSR